MKLLSLVSLVSLVISATSFADRGASEDSSLVRHLEASVCLYNHLDEHQMEVSYNWGGEEFETVRLEPHTYIILKLRFPEGSYPQDLNVKFGNKFEGEGEAAISAKPYIARFARRDCGLSHRMKFVASESIAGDIELVSQN